MNSNIQFQKINQIGLITLNRPNALNALTLDMCIQMREQLIEWQIDKNVKAVIVNTANNRAFCAGGDIRRLYELGKQDPALALPFFWHEYRLNWYIFNFPKPYISLLNGITMGGGMGISVNGSHRIATENLLMAMPETGIGFTPDVGASYFLSHCPGYSGFYLGLTGNKITAGDAYYLGLANYFVPSHYLNILCNSLIGLRFEQDAQQEIANVIERFSTTPPLSSLALHQAQIDACFSKKTVEEIIAALRSHNGDWCRETEKILLTRSPTSLKVTLESLQRGKSLDFTDCLTQEYRLGGHFLNSHDLFEGIRAAIIDKDRKPHWQPAELSDVTSENVQKYFLPLAIQDLHFY